MKLSEIPKEELELMGYDDIAYIILQESGKKMKLVDIFKKVCSSLELPEATVEAQLMDFFELMSINKKFTMLDNGYWDLQSRHKVDIIVEDGDDEDELPETDVEIDEEDLENEEEDIFYDKDDDTDDVVEDELSDLMVIDADDEQNM